MFKILSRRIKDSTTLDLLEEIIYSFKIALPPKRGIPPGRNIGMPIGNLTSQIFANIYLNELDRFVKHDLKMKAYLRYGDDFIILDNDLERLRVVRAMVGGFLANKLKLQINPNSDRVMKVSHGLKFLGVQLWPSGGTLNNRNQIRVKERLKVNNISSYSGMVKKHGNSKKVREFNWLVCEKLAE